MIWTRWLGGNKRQQLIGFYGDEQRRKLALRKEREKARKKPEGTPLERRKRIIEEKGFKNKIEMYGSCNVRAKGRKEIRVLTGFTPTFFLQIEGAYNKNRPEDFELV